LKSLAWKRQQRSMTELSQRPSFFTTQMNSFMAEKTTPNTLLRFNVNGMNIQSDQKAASTETSAVAFGTSISGSAFPPEWTAASTETSAVAFGTRDPRPSTSSSGSAFPRGPDRKLVQNLMERSAAQSGVRLPSPSAGPVRQFSPAPSPVQSVPTWQPPSSPRMTSMDSSRVAMNRDSSSATLIQGGSATFSATPAPARSGSMGVRTGFAPGRGSGNYPVANVPFGGSGQFPVGGSGNYAVGGLGGSGIYPGGSLPPSWKMGGTSPGLQSPRQAQKTCPGGHPLQAARTPHDACWCSVCGHTFRQGTVLYGCRHCDYDECEQCLAKAAPPRPINGGFPRPPTPVMTWQSLDLPFSHSSSTRRMSGSPVRRNSMSPPVRRTSMSPPVSPPMSPSVPPPVRRMSFAMPHKPNGFSWPVGVDAVPPVQVNNSPERMDRSPRARSPRNVRFLKSVEPLDTTYMRALEAPQPDLKNNFLSAADLDSARSVTPVQKSQSFERRRALALINRDISNGIIVDVDVLSARATKREIYGMPNEMDQNRHNFSRSDHRRQNKPAAAEDDHRSFWESGICCCADD